MSSIQKTNLFVLFLFVLQFILGLFWSSLMTMVNMPIVINMILSQICMFGIPTILYFIITKSNVKDTLSIKPISPLNILIIVAISIFIQPIMTVLSALTTIFFPNNVTTMLTETAKIPIWLTIIATALTPAIFEEIIFRGIVFSGYRTTSLLKASIMTGLLFGLIHCDAQQFLYAFVMGIFFCFLVYRTGSIFASMISHFTINGSQVLISTILMSSMSSEELLKSTTNTNISDIIASLISSIFLACITAPILILLIWAFIKINKKPEIPEGKIYYNIPKQKQDFIAGKPLAGILLIYFLQVIIIPFAYIIVYVFQNIT